MKVETKAVTFVLKLMKIISLKQNEDYMPESEYSNGYELMPSILGILDLKLQLTWCRKL